MEKDLFDNVWQRFCDIYLLEYSKCLFGKSLAPS